jgi:hypothetical protein
MVVASATDPVFSREQETTGLFTRAHRKTPRGGDNDEDNDEEAEASLLLSPVSSVLSIPLSGIYEILDPWLAAKCPVRQGFP